jgi:hypothetical protein
MNEVGAGCRPNSVILNADFKRKLIAMSIFDKMKQIELICYCLFK